MQLLPRGPTATPGYETEIGVAAVGSAQADFRLVIASYAGGPPLGHARPATVSCPHDDAFHTEYGTTDEAGGDRELLPRCKE